MDYFGIEIKFLTKEQICKINRQMIKEFGGLFIEPNNFQNENSLDYVIAAIKSDIYDMPFSISIQEKASILAFRIIKSHVFVDGNKRTAIFAAWEMLKANDINIKLDDSVVNLAVSIAEGTVDVKDVLNWFNRHQSE